MNKFSKLKEYLSKSQEDEIKMSFKELEVIVGYPLPESARKHPAYFANTETHSISKAWMEAGYFVTNLDIHNGLITFKRADVSEERVLSTDVFLRLLDGKKKMEGNCVVTIVSLYEALSLRKRTYQEVCSFLDSYHIKIVGPDYAPVTRDNYRQNENKLEVALKNIYNSVVSYSLLCCLLNVFRGQQKRLDKVFGVFEKESESNLLVDLPLCNDASIGIVGFKRLLSKVVASIDKTLDVEDVVSRIGNLVFPEMSLVAIKGIDYLTTSYCNHLLRLFIVSCKEKKPFIPFSLVVEMLNVSLISSKKNALYLTEDDSHYDILQGSTVRRIIRIGEDSNGENKNS